MRYSAFKVRHWVSLLVVAILFVGIVSHTPAREETGTLSGRVVDSNGDPVPDLPVFVAPLTNLGGHLWQAFLPDAFDQLHRARTNQEGQFSITDIPAGPVYFGALPYNIDERLPSNFKKIVDDFNARDWREITEADIEAFVSSNFGMDQVDFQSDIEVLSVRIGGLTFYPRTDSDEIAVGIKSGAHVKNVRVTVQPRMRVRGRIVFKNETPLANARVRVYIRYSDVNGIGFGSSSENLWTGADGSFICYLDEKDDTAFYTFLAVYQELSAESEPVHLEPGERSDGVVVQFDSAPVPPKPPQKTEVDASGVPLEPPTKPMSQDVWVVNPANGHAYKRARCETHNDAITQASDEKAHLVTINNAEEQAWLEAVFGQEFYWIGLSDVEQNGQWQWDNGEPLTYENWLPDDFFFESLEVGERDYAIITFAEGKWYAVGPDSAVWSMTQMAILEKTQE